MGRIPEAQAAHSPLVAIVMCPDTYAVDWYGTHASSQALVGLANLVGVPYRTLTLDELLAPDSEPYTSIWFASCVYIGEESMPDLVALLRTHTTAGNSVFLDGPLGTAYRDASGDDHWRSMLETFPFLGVYGAGWFDIPHYTVHTTDAVHPAAARAGHAPGTQLTQGIEYGTQTMGVAHEDDRGNAVLLELWPPGAGRSYPFLVSTQAPGDGARVLAIAAYGSYVGAGTPFRNDEPAGFHDNQLLPYVIEALLWLLEPGDAPFVGLQISHAPMTVVGRLDGDWSNAPEATLRTLQYLVDMGKRTGVTTVYGIVSSFAEQTSWGGFYQLAAALEELGGSIGSHSDTHNYDMSENLAAGQWYDEVHDSLVKIRAALTSGSYAPEAIAFINPGNTIRSGDYGRFFDSIELYMTHGFETSVPYATGVMGFGLPEGVDPVVVINNTPAPDFQWFYLQDWMYTVAEATSYQDRILDYYQDTIGRGVLYNQMWHDYAIDDGAMPLHFPDEPTLRPLFDLNVDHFATRRIFAPSVRELIAKMHLQRAARVSSEWDGATLEVTIEHDAPAADRLGYLAGMGLRVHNPAGPIAEVTINGQAHHAFTDDTVLLPPPPLPDSTQRLAVRFGEPAGLRLSYISKRFDDVSSADGRLEVWPTEHGLATRFCVVGAARGVILGADAFARAGADELCGMLQHDSDAMMFTAEESDSVDIGLRFDGADRPLVSVQVDGQVVTIDVGPGGAGQLDFAAYLSPARVTVAGASIPVQRAGDLLVVPVPAATEVTTVVITMSEPGSGCGCSSGSSPRPGDGLLVVLALAGLALSGRARPARGRARR